MKPSEGAEFTTGEGAILVEFRSTGAPITPEAQERARKRAVEKRDQELRRSLPLSNSVPSEIPPPAKSE